MGIAARVESRARRNGGYDCGARLIDTLPRDRPERLKNSPLELVVAQVQFPAILSIQTDDARLARFQDEIRDKYPYLFLGQQFGFNVGPQGVEQQQVAAKVYQFADANREWSVTLTANSIALEARNYTDYDDFSERVLRIVDAARKVYRIEFRQRLGLRYVNEMRHPSVRTAEDWTSLVNPQLLGPLADKGLSSLVNFSYQETGLQLKNGKLTLRHGHFAQGTTVAPPPGEMPKERADPFYLLDFDAFDEEGRDINGHTLEELLRGYNHTMFQLLRWGVQEDLFDYLKGE